MGSHLQFSFLTLQIGWVDIYMKICPMYNIVIICILLCGLVDILPLQYPSNHMTSSKINRNYIINKLKGVMC